MNIDKILSDLKSHRITIEQAEQLMNEVNTLAPVVTDPASNITMPAVAASLSPDQVEDIERTLADTLAKTLLMDLSEIDIERPFIDMGLDSIVGVEWTRELNNIYQLTLPATVMYDYPTIVQLQGYIAKVLNDQAAGSATEPASPAPANPEPHSLKSTASPAVGVKLAFGAKPSTKPSTKPATIPATIPATKPAIKPQSAADLGADAGLVISSVHLLSEIGLSHWQVPAPKADEVRIAVRASAINFPDVMCINGLYPTMPDYPFVPGFEVAGVIAAIGDQVTGFKLGDEVMAVTGEQMGGHGTFVNVPQKNIALKPHNISFEQACSLPVAYGIIEHAFELAKLSQDEEVLIQTATGGCGLLALQLARLRGARCWGTSSREAKLAVLRRLNVSQALNYKTADLAGQIRRLSGDRGVDVVLNMLSGDAIQQGLNSLASGGRYLEIAVHALKTSPKLDLSQLVHNQTIHSIDLRRRSLTSGEGAQPSLQRMAALLASQLIVPIVSRVYPFSQLAEALQYVGQASHIGKVVISHSCQQMTDYTEQCIADMEQQEQRAAQYCQEYCQEYRQALATAPSASVLASPAFTSPAFTSPAFTSPTLATHSPSPAGYTAIAVVGMAGQFPQAPTIDDFWHNITTGKDCVSKVPESRWSNAEYYDPDPQASGKTNCQWMGVLEGADQFDPQFFSLSPNEAPWMDPQQRLFLQNSWHCIEAAGISPEDLSGSQCGVFVGVASSDYAQVNDHHHLCANGLTGRSLSILAARISFFLNLQGPCLTLDTACSSSLVAIAEACNHLSLGACDAALAGGVSILAKPTLHIMAAKAEMLSADGRCYTFDHRANGFVPSEGVGVVLLKRLTDAQANGDTILGVIRGWAINQDGKTNGITAPSAVSQRRLQQQVYQTAGINPRSITLIEAHGTGTALGDPIEVRALTESFAEFTTDKQFCALGSVKSSIGHSVAAAGVSGFIKLLLAFKHQQLPPNGNFQQLNQHIHLADSPFYINQKLTPWQVPAGQPRRAAISSFGFSGTNAHLVIDEAPLCHRQHQPQSHYLIVLSGRIADQLNQQVVQLIPWLAAQQPGVDLGDLSYTLMTGRKHFRHRLAVVVDSVSQLITQLKQWLAAGQAAGVLTAVGSNSKVKQDPAVTQKANDAIEQSHQQADITSLTPIANAYISGYDLAYGDLYGSGYRRLTLPLYPFAQHRYWEPAILATASTGVAQQVGPPTEQAKVAQPAPAPVFTPALAPLAVTENNALPSLARVTVSLAEVSTIGPCQQRSLARVSCGLRGVSTLGSLTPTLTSTPTLTPTSGPTSAQVTMADLDRGIYRLTLAPQAQLTETLTRQLTEQLNQLQARPAAKVILFTGADEGFLNQDSGSDCDDHLFRQLQQLISACPLPIIAVMKGDSSYNGWLLASVCDLLLVSVDGQYTVGHSPLDKGPSNGQNNRYQQQWFAERFGPLAAQWPTTLTGQQLIDHGIGLEPLSRAEIDNAALNMARALAAMPTISLTELKQHFARPAQLLLQGHSLTAEPVACDPEPLGQQSWLPLAGVSGDVNPSQHPHQVTLPDNLPKTTAVPLDSPVVSLLVSDNGVVQITLKDQAHKNMLSAALVAGIEEAFAYIAIQPNYKVVIITGYDQYFSLGGTKEGLEAIQQGQLKFTDTQVYSIALRCQIPVIAAMQGHGMGAGWAMGMYCDFTIFSEQSVYISPYMGYGFTPGAGATLVFPDKFGKDLGKEILFSSFEYKGKALQQRGITQPVLPGDQVLSYAWFIAMGLAQQSRSRLVVHKSLCTAHLHRHVQKVYQLEAAMHELTFIGNQTVLDKVQQQFLETQSPVAARSAKTVETAETGKAQSQTDHATGASGPALAAITETLRITLAAQLGLEADEIEDDLEFMEMGLDSVVGVTWIRTINQTYQLTVAVTKVYQYPTIETFAQYIGQLLATAGAIPAPAQEAPTAVVAPANQGPEITSIVQSLRQTLADQLGLSDEEIEDDLEFMEMGLDSVVGVTWIRKLNQLFDLTIPVTKVYQYSTIIKLAEHIQQQVAALQGQPSQPAAAVMAAEPAEKTNKASNQGGVYNPFVKKPQTAAPAAPAKLAPVKAAAPVKAVPVKSMPMPMPMPAAQAKGVNSVKLAPLTGQPSGQTPSNGQPAIAVIGMAGRFPEAETIDELWQNIIAKRNCVKEIPSSRWPLADYYDPTPQSANKSYSKWMGMVAGVDEFDPLFFNISPQEARQMDPQQRLFLQASWQCIEAAGYNPAALSGSLCGVFVGCGPNDYGYDIPANEDMNAERLMGSSSSILSGRVSFLLNLQGPCISIDTACSSSLVAITSACDSLLLGNSDVALAGGVCVMAGPTIHIMTSDAGMMSADGHCYTFDNRANGFVPGEGVGVVMLKRLADAERDNDQIDAIICGWGTNQDGKTNGITAPNPESQARLEKQIYQRFAINPQQIQLIETHGTGTKLGDPIEIEALIDSFGGQAVPSPYCALGSVKSNIGHLQAAAGVVSVIKMVMALKHQQLPPSANFNQLNEFIDLDNTPFYVNTSLKPWQVAGGERRQGAVSAFGFGGTNAHMVLAEYQPTATISAQPSTDPRALILLSAKSPAQLTTQVQQLLDHLTSKGLDSAADDQPALLQRIAYTLQVGRQPMKERLAVISASVVGLCQSLQNYLTHSVNSVSVDNCYRGKVGKVQPVAQYSPQTKQAIEMALTAWTDQHQHKPLVDLWLQGLVIDWTKLYPQPPQRLCLPTYPFAKERYWLQPAAALLASGAALESKSASGAAPARPIPAVNAQVPIAVAPARTTFDPAQWLQVAEQWQAADFDQSPRQWRERIKQKGPQRVLILAHQLADSDALQKALAQQWGEQANVLLVDVLMLSTTEAQPIGEYLATHNSPDVVFYLDRPGQPREPLVALGQLYETCRGLAKVASSQTNQLYYCYQTSDSMAIAYQQGLSGLFRAIAMEQPSQVYRSVEMAAAELDNGAYVQLVQEWLAFNDHGPLAAQLAMVRFEQQQRYTSALVELDMATKVDISGVFKATGTYLIAGGLGEVAQLVCQQLAAQFAPRLVILSRRALDGEVAQILDRIRSAGSQVDYYPVDITDQEALGQVYQQIKTEVGAINGVIHFARQVKDGLLATKSFAEFSQTMAAKVQGSLNLDLVTAAEPLDFFILYSSMAAFGIAGSADYGYATAVQNAVVRQRNQRLEQGQRRGKSVALCFGQWVVDPYSNEQRDAMLTKAGFSFIDVPSAIALMVSGLRSPADVIGMMAVRSREQVKALYGLTAPAEPKVAIEPVKAPALGEPQLLGETDQDVLKTLLANQSVAQLESLLQTLNSNRL